MTPGDSAAPRDRGSALIIVLGMMTVLAVFVSVALTYATSSLRVIDRSEDNQNALAAAEAGVADYLARLNRSDQYWQSYDCSNVALKGPAAPGNGCGWTTTTKPGWLPVPGAARSSFHYDVVTTSTYSRGTIVLSSTGKVGQSTRTVQVNLRRGGFGEFLYYTVYETVDPANQVVYANTSNAQRDCSRYWWANPTRPAYNDDNRTGCPDITFTSGDVIRGPLHTNDALLTRGNPSFQGSVTTSVPSCKPPEGGAARPATACYRRSSSSDNPTFARGIGWRAEIELSDSIGDLRKYVTPGTPGLQNGPGCLYSGPTRIKFLPTTGSSTPRMTVWSRWTAAATLNPGCGAVSDLRSASGATIAVPQENLIYVQDVPSGQQDPAVSSSGCKQVGAVGDGFPVSSGNGYYEFSQYLDESSCTYGNAFVEGAVKGRVTLTTDNNIVVTGDLTYAGGESGTDALGLIAKNSVKIYHPLKVNCQRVQNNSCTSYTLSEINRPSGTRFLNPKIYAAIQTLQHSFTVQSYSEGGDLGTLKVFGTIAQRYRGPVGTGNGQTVSTGYLKDYTYDSRLRYAPPPYFLDPVRSGWGQKTFGETTAAYKP